MPKAAIYARVSTKDQECEIQLEALKAYCSRMKYDYDTYAENVSAVAKVRPEFERLMAACRMGKVDIVIVTRLDRWARSVIQAVQSINELRAHNVKWVAIEQGLNSDDTAISKVVISLLGVIAEFERELIYERTQAGILKARKEGKKFGRHRIVFDREKVYNMRTRDNMKWSDISKSMNMPRSTLIYAYDCYVREVVNAK